MDIQTKITRVSTFKKILYTLIISYTIIGKSYTTIFFIHIKEFNLSNLLFIHFTNIAMLLLLLVIMYVVWGRYGGIKLMALKYKWIYKMLITVIVIIQLFLFLLDFMTKNPNINQTKVLIIGDIPNLISIIVSIILIFPNNKKVDLANKIQL